MVAALSQAMKLEPSRQPILETERLRLQPLTPADAPLLFHLMDDPEVMAYWDIPHAPRPRCVGAAGALG